MFNLRQRFSNPQPRYDQGIDNLIMNSVNEVRAAYGRPALVFHEGLWTPASYHSNDMYARHYFSHFSPENASPMDRCIESGLVLSVGENLYFMTHSNLGIVQNEAIADNCINGWINSPPHFENMLNPEWQYIAPSTLLDGHVVLVTALFGAEPRGYA